MTAPPYAFDVDEQGWLREGCGRNRIVGHNLRTNALCVIPLPQMGGRPIFQAFAWDEKLVLVRGAVPSGVRPGHGSGTDQGMEARLHSEAAAQRAGISDPGGVRGGDRVGCSRARSPRPFAPHADGRRNSHNTWHTEWGHLNRADGPPAVFDLSSKPGTSSFQQYFYTTGLPIILTSPAKCILTGPNNPETVCPSNTYLDGIPTL